MAIGSDRSGGALKVGVVAFGSGPTPPDGQDEYVPALSGALAARGHDVVLLTHQPVDTTRAAGGQEAFVTSVLDAGTPSSTESPTLEHVGEFTRGLSRALRTGGFDVLHSQGWLAGMAAGLTAPGQHVPLVHTFHDSLLIDTADEVREHPGRLRAERAFAARADHLIATSTLDKQRLIRAGVPRSRVTVVPHGVTADPHLDDKVPRADGAQSHLLAFGPPSRIAAMLDVLVLLPRAALVGCLTPPDPSHAADRKLAERAEALGVAERLRLRPATGPTQRAELIDGSDIVLCLNTQAHPGIEHLEAMARGVPVVAGNDRAAEAVIDGVTGAHAMTLSPRRLAALVRDLMASPITRHQMGLAGRDRVLNRYSWHQVAAETERVYYPLVAHRDRTVPVPRSA